MERTPGGSPLEREPIDAGGVEPVHGRPAIEPIADIGGHALLAREPDEARDEAVIAVAMDRRGKPDGRCPYAVFHQRGRRRLRFAGIGRRVEWRHILLGRHTAGARSATPDVTSSGRSEPSSTAPIASMACRSSAQFSTNFEKS